MKFKFSLKALQLFIVFDGFVIPGCSSTDVPLVFGWYSERDVLLVLRVIFRCSATVPGCSAVPSVLHVPLFGVPAFLVF